MITVAPNTSPEHPIPIPRRLNFLPDRASQYPMQLSLDYLDLPPYRVRVSGRAKRPSVTVCLHEGIVVTVPRRFNTSRLPALLAEWRPWLDRQLATLQRQQAALPPQNRQLLPQRIDLAASGRSCRVELRATAAQSVQVREQSDSLQLIGTTGDRALCRQALRRWLAREARRHLEPLTAALADTHGFRYARIGIRGQRTRWGSCSSTGTISLNYYLMFLAPELVNCVVLHELCHTRHMNHGRRFHALLGRLVPNYRELDQRVNTGWQEIPAWAWRR